MCVYVRVFRRPSLSSDDLAIELELYLHSSFNNFPYKSIGRESVGIDERAEE